MKKYAITSICTLVLSLLSAFGLNQNSINGDANSIATESVENIQYIEDDKNLPGDNQTNAAEADVPAAEATDNNKVTDGYKEENGEKIRENNQDKNTAADNNTQNTDSKLQKVKNTGKKINGESQTKPQPTPVSVNDAKCSIVNGQVYFGNINLSNCKSAADAVKVLNDNGYKNITVNNISNIESLNEILAYIKNSSENTAAKAPAKINTGSDKAEKTPTKAAPTAAPTATPTTAPTAAPTKAPAKTADTSIGNYAGEVLRLVNVERAKAGLPALTTNSTLTAAANKRAQETKQSFSHTRPDGSSCFTVLAEYGISYRTAGENIAYGQRTPQEVVNGWMNSPGHRANILKSSFGKVGIGVYESNGVIYWSQLFTD